MPRPTPRTTWSPPAYYETAWHKGFRKVVDAHGFDFMHKQLNCRSWALNDVYQGWADEPNPLIDRIRNLYAPGFPPEASDSNFQPYMNELWWLDLKRLSDTVSVTEAAEHIGVSRPTISRILSGDLPASPVTDVIAKKLDKRPCLLCSDKPDPTATFYQCLCWAKWADDHNESGPCSRCAYNPMRRGCWTPSDQVEQKRIAVVERHARRDA